MKKLGFLLISLFFVAVSVHNANAQTNQASVADAQTTANIIQPITLSNTTPLNFGNIIPGSSAGSVVMNTSNERSSTGGVTLQPDVNGQAAVFNVTGLTGAEFTITLPSSDVTLTRDGGTEEMSIASATFNHNAGASPIITGGNVNFNVGATLSVDANQEEGIYTGNYAVTVAYH
jgi:uncharacterized protein DUF4402